MSRPALPFFTAYDPIGTSEGTLDPMGLYQIADQLAVRLVPAVRERMQRIRFLTTMAVGTRVIEDIAGVATRPDSAPFLAWEWLVVEAFVRASESQPMAQGVAGVQVVRRAIEKFGHVDATTYLKTPRVFGFHGIYKRLAVHLGITDVHLELREQGAALVDAWMDDFPDGGRAGAARLIERCAIAVRRGLEKRPPRTAAPFGTEEWEAVAGALNPDRVGRREKRLLRDLLLQQGDAAVGALAPIWHCLEDVPDEAPDAEVLQELAARHPEYASLVGAIDAFERFARGLQDAFDCMRNAAGEAGMLELPLLASVPEFTELTAALPSLYADAERAFASDGAAQGTAFAARFAPFGSSMAPEALANEVLAHHVRIQRDKSAGGKRPWFDAVDDARRYWRASYRLPAWSPNPGTFVHEYRCAPIRRFRKDLT